MSKNSEVVIISAEAKNGIANTAVTFDTEPTFNIDNLEKLDAVKARQDKDFNRHFAQVVVDMADGKEVAESVLLWAMQWKGCTVQQLKELAVLVNERRATAKKIGDLRASQAGIPDARAAVHACEAKLKAAEDEHRSNITGLYCQLRQLEEAGARAAQLERELRQTSGMEYHRNIQEVDKDLVSIRERLNVAQIESVQVNGALKNSIENLEQNGPSDLGKARVEYNRTQAKKSAEAVIAIEAELSAATQRRIDILNAALVATAAV